MSETWTRNEYRLTNAIYEAALSHRRDGKGTLREDIVARCRKATGREAEGKMLAHLGALSSARRALGLETLPDFPPLVHYPRKLLSVLDASR
ncbi:MAG: hypothetical protein VYD87_06710 [Pseudomonadota bacterium]|nr:hypothetical protein [Pseudomonadota bacterium]MEE3098728.1 hypothetical protein [Pseudomonadota bacterium]